ncbi:hypothetical protein Tco_0873917 [Tanacetum coccineum]|uniref:Uncharacterized protein n=1 Tax=Tanacetum coccineum TaxID=301880 RepID=A0ABQ5BNA3_9ASTR
MANEGDKNVGGASGIVVDENRGREESRQGDKRSRGASRDTVANLAKRMVGVKTSMLELKERVKKSHRHLEALGSDFPELREDFKSALNVLGGNLGCEIHDLRGMLMGEITRMRGEWGRGNTSNIAPKVKVLKPSPFMGKREARAVDDLLWEMEQYMEDIERGTCTINTWADFVQDELKKQFYLKNAKHEEKSRLHKLKHSGMTREMEKTELERRGVQDLSTAIAHAHALIDLVEWRSRKSTNEDSGDEQVGGEKQVKDLDDRAQRPPRKEITKESPAVGAKNKVRVESPKIRAKSKRAPKVETKDEAKRLGLETMKDIGWIKAVNGDAKAISGVAQGVKPKIEGWGGELDLLVVAMDDYKLVLEMEFFDKVWFTDGVVETHSFLIIAILLSLFSLIAYQGVHGTDPHIFRMDQGNLEHWNKLSLRVFEIYADLLKLLADAIVYSALKVSDVLSYMAPGYITTGNRKE